MATIDKPARRGTPWHLWLIGLVTLVWNGFGALDYYMTQTLNVAWLEMSGMGAQQIAWLATFPWWARLFWAFGVWGALLGSILLLARSKRALTAYIVSFIGIGPMTVFQFGSDHPGSLNGVVPAIFALFLVAVTVAQAWYAYRMRIAGVLR